MNFFKSTVQRRSFFTRFGGGATALMTTMGGVVPPQSALASRWQPKRHKEDDWLDRRPAKHRFVFDSTMPDGFGYALLYASNYFVANKDGYGLQDSDLAVVIVARHFATPFAFNDAMWKKYGAAISRLANFIDPKTNQAPTSNLYNLADYGLPNRSTTLDALIKRGAQFAVCQMATRQLAEPLAAAVGDNAESVFKELSANLVSNSHLVPAGIVAVNRAQERGYSFVSA
jgi:intracellular sulfur oxidation DsrE/DsrF family protein